MEIPKYKHDCSFMREQSLPPVGNYMLKAKNRNINTRCKICSKLTTKRPERSHDANGVILVSLLLTFEHISHLALPSVCIANSEQPQVNAKEPYPSLRPALHPV